MDLNGDQLKDFQEADTELDESDTEIDEPKPDVKRKRKRRTVYDVLEDTEVRSISQRKRKRRPAYSTDIVSELNALRKIADLDVRRVLQAAQLLEEKYISVTTLGCFHGVARQTNYDFGLFVDNLFKQASRTEQLFLYDYCRSQTSFAFVLSRIERKVLRDSSSSSK